MNQYVVCSTAGSMYIGVRVWCWKWSTAYRTRLLCLCVPPCSNDVSAQWNCQYHGAPGVGCVGIDGEKGAGVIIYDSQLP